MVFPKQTSTSFFVWEPANRRTAQSVVLPPLPSPRTFHSHALIYWIAIYLFI